MNKPRPRKLPSQAALAARAKLLAARKSVRESAGVIETNLKTKLRSATSKLSAYDRFLEVLVARQMDLQAQKLGLNTDYAGRVARLVGARPLIGGKKIAHAWESSKLGEKALAASIGLKVTRIEKATF